MKAFPWITILSLALLLGGCASIAHLPVGTPSVELTQDMIGAAENAVGADWGHFAEFGGLRGFRLPDGTVDVCGHVRGGADAGIFRNGATTDFEVNIARTGVFGNPWVANDAPDYPSNYQTIFDAVANNEGIFKGFYPACFQR